MPDQPTNTTNDAKRKPQQDPEVVQRVAERVWELWRAYLRQERERRSR